MAGKGTRMRPESSKNAEEEDENEVVIKKLSDEKPSADLASSPPDTEQARTRLRERWELASALNFLRVFKPIIQSKLDISAEEIETALITANDDLCQLHISLLKGIPPASKNLTGPDAWVTILYKKVIPWWPWVAEGEIPLEAPHGEESSRYKKLDPIDRLLILKALCEIRALQDDSVSFVNDALKQGTEVCTFRIDRIGVDSAGITYWNDGDEVLGYRLYREVTKMEFTPRKAKGRLAQPPNRFQWETLATNLDEFQEISDKFSSSEIVGEAVVGEFVKNEMIPVLERIEKKKERALKRQQRQVMQLNGYLNCYGLGGTRSCRNRKPVNYTFDEFDRSIDEAIQLNKKRKTSQEPKPGQKGARHEGSTDVNSNGNTLNNGVIEHDSDDGDNYDDEDEDDGKFRRASDSDSGDEDYDDTNDENNGNDENDEEGNNHNRHGELVSSMGKNHGLATRANGHSQKKNGHMTRDVSGLRRSKRITGNAGQSDMETGETKRQRSHASDSDSDTTSDSDDESSSKSSIEKTSEASKDSLGVEGLHTSEEVDEE